MKQLEHDLASDECFALAATIGAAWARMIAPKTVVAGWSVPELDAAVQLSVDHFRADLAAGGADAQDVEAIVDAMVSALGRNGKQLVTLLTETGGRA